MILYHGSNVEIDCIDLNKSMRGKDFGQGFYLSADRAQAEEMAVFKAMQFDGTPVVTAFELDEQMLSSLKTKRFDGYSLEWAENPRTGLNFQSPVYVFDFLQRELEQGKIA